jgi:GDP-L-fucose synthase
MTSETIFSLEGRRIFVAGHAGMVGSAIVRRLSAQRCDVLTVSRSEVDLRDQARTRAWMLAQRPDVVVLAAARVGGILANATYPVEFLHDNLMIEANVIESAYRAGVRKLLFLGSSCIYPKHAPQPMDEDTLLSGPSRRPTSGMPSRRSRVSSCARLIGSNMAVTSSPGCRRTSTVTGTILISRPGMSCRH